MVKKRLRCPPFYMIELSDTDQKVKENPFRQTDVTLAFAGSKSWYILQDICYKFHM